MEIQIIKYKNGYLGVSEEEFIGFRDWCIDETNIIRQISVNDANYLDVRNNYNKIICTTPDLELEGVPLIDLDLDLIESIEEHYGVPYKEVVEETVEVDVFKAGYNSAKGIYKFTENDLREAIELAVDKGRLWISSPIAADEYKEELLEATTEIIKQVSKPKEIKSVKIEMEQSHIERSRFTKMAYIVYQPKIKKINGKDYVIIKKIIYKIK